MDVVTTIDDELATRPRRRARAGPRSLPFALIHGEALVAAAAWALGEAGVTPIDTGTTWEALVDAEEPFVLHDALCPMTPPEFIAACVAARRRATAAWSSASAR